MRITAMRPIPDPGGGATTLARFDVQVTDDLRLRDLILRRLAGGRLAVFAPKVRGGNVATFSPHLAARLVAAALKQLEGTSPHDEPEAIAP